MANLKTELDEYLLQNNESRRSFKLSLPFSKPSFLTKNADASPTESSGNWFSEKKNEYCALSRTQRFMGFAACLGFGILCFILSGFYIPFLIIKARKFAMLFTLGSLFFILSFTFLYGPWTHIKSLFSKERALQTSIYGSTLIATLYCAMSLQNTVLTVIFAVLQVLALLWVVVGYVPGGSSGMRVFGSMFKSTVSNTLPV